MRRSRERRRVMKSKKRRSRVRKSKRTPMKVRRKSKTITTRRWTLWERSGDVSHRQREVMTTRTRTFTRR